VERGDAVYLEKVNQDLMTDYTTSDSSLSATITGLGDYNLNTVRAYTDTTNYGTFTVNNDQITLPSTPTETVYVGYDFDYALTSNKIAIQGQTENIEKRISKATIVTSNTDLLTFEGQQIAQSDDVYEYYGVTQFERDCRFAITGTFNYVEILSILLNINYGAK
jgi:hypothetical protein